MTVKNIPYIVTVFILAFMPLIVASIIIYAMWGAYIIDFHVPTSLEIQNTIAGSSNIDEVYHWHQIETFTSAGFNGGYYTLAEIPANNDLFRFFAWGPFPTIFYGSIANIIGFNHLTMIIINVMFFALGVLTLAYSTKLEPPQIAMLFILFTFFPNIVLAMPSTGLTMLNIIMGLYIAIAVYLLLVNTNTPSNLLVFVLLSLLVVSALFRVSWVVIYPPIIALMGWRYKQWSGALIGFFISMVLAFSVYHIFGQTAAPYESLIDINDNIDVLISAIRERAMFNLSNFFFGLTFWVLLRFACIMVIIGVLYQLCLIILKKSDLYSIPEVLFHLINIVGIMLANLLIYFYVEGRDFRTIGPHLFLSLLLLILFKRYRLVFPVLLIFILGFPNMLQSHIIWKAPHFREVIFDYETYERDLAENGIVYAESENGWCNTVSFTNYFKLVPEYLLGLRGGLGLTQFALFDEYDTVPKSQFLMLDYDYIPEALSIWDLEPLMQLPNGMIYRNLHSRCS